MTTINDAGEIVVTIKGKIILPNIHVEWDRVLLLACCNNLVEVLSMVVRYEQLVSMRAFPKDLCPPPTGVSLWLEVIQVCFPIDMEVASVVC